MSDYLDKAKVAAKDITDKARGTVGEHSDKIDHHIDRAGAYVDDKTKGKYTDKIDSVTSKAHDVVGKIAKDDGGTQGDAGTKGDGGTKDDGGTQGDGRTKGDDSPST